MSRSSPTTWSARRALARASDLVLAHSPAPLAELAALGAVPRRSAVIEHGPLPRSPRPPRCASLAPATGPASSSSSAGSRSTKGSRTCWRRSLALPAGDAAQLTVAGPCPDAQAPGRAAGTRGRAGDPRHAAARPRARTRRSRRCWPRRRRRAAVPPRHHQRQRVARALARPAARRARPGRAGRSPGSGRTPLRRQHPRAGGRPDPAAHGARRGPGRDGGRRTGLPGWTDLAGHRAADHGRDEARCSARRGGPSPGSRSGRHDPADRAAGRSGSPDAPGWSAASPATRSTAVPCSCSSTPWPPRPSASCSGRWRRTATRPRPSACSPV